MLLALRPIADGAGHGVATEGIDGKAIENAAGARDAEAVARGRHGNPFLWPISNHALSVAADPVLLDRGGAGHGAAAST